MKTKILGLLTLMLMAAAPSFAQMQRMSVEDRVKANMEQLKPLNLSQDQITKTEDVYKNFYQNMQQTMQQARQSGQRPDRSVFQKSMDDRDAALQKIFTSDQFKTYKDKIEKNMMGSGNRGQGGNRGNWQNRNNNGGN